jgi:arsenite-transporting ATPase
VPGVPSPVRVLLFMGKGGVGKTTTACASAITAADMGHRVLLVSTDAAHSLSDVLELQCEAEPTKVTDQLDVVQLDGQNELQRSWSTIADYLRQLVGFAALDRLRVDELMVLPGLDELVALSRLRSLIMSDRWDAVVVDCAPSADSLRLLSLPDILGFYIDRLFGTDGPTDRWIRKRVARTLSIPAPDDALIASVSEFTNELSQLRAMLGTADLSARIVVTPERVVVAEGLRTLSYLALYGFSADAVVVNRAPLPEFADTVLAGWAAAQRDQLDVIESSFAPLPRLIASHRLAEPVGLAALRELGAELYGQIDPTARLADVEPIEITSTGDETAMRVFLPGIDRDDVRVEREGDELALTLGTRRRLVRIPAGLNARHIVRAGFTQPHLEIVFGVPVHAV